MVDPFAEVGKWLRVLSGLALGAFACLFALPVLILPIGLVALAQQGEWDLVGFLAISIPVYAVLAAVFFWLARRLLRGTRSPDGVTAIPLWFIQAVGAFMLLGLLVLVYQAHIKRDPEVPEIPHLFYVGSIPIIVTMIIVPWLARRRLRYGEAREKRSCESQSETISRMPQYHCHILISLAYNLGWSENQAEADRLREALRQIEPQPIAINEPSETELRALNIHLPPGAFLKVTYLIEAATPDEAATALRTIVDQIEIQNQPTWWFIHTLPIEAE